MKKKLFLFYCCNFFLMISNAQNLTPNIISAAGGVSSGKSSDILLEWTLGESSVGTATTFNRLYTVGFHQPVLVSRSIVQQNESGESNLSQVRVYPNPVENTLRVQFHFTKYDNVKIILSDLLGRALLEKTVNGKSMITEIPVYHLVSGVYQLLISDLNGSPISTFKIIKAN